MFSASDGKVVSYGALSPVTLMVNESFTGAAAALITFFTQIPLNWVAGMSPIDSIVAELTAAFVNVTEVGAVVSVAMVAIVTFTASTANATSASVSADGVSVPIHTPADS
jgi:hypothetical protein